MIHHTHGVYNDGSYKDNGVKSENLANHIQYNINGRPGRALFVDGYCIHVGYLGLERCNEIEKQLYENPIKMTKDTMPYV